MPEEGTGFVQLVVDEIKTLKAMVEKQDGKIETLRTAISALQIGEIHQLALEVARLRTAFEIKAGVWGAVGAAIPMAIGALVWFLQK